MAIHPGLSWVAFLEVIRRQHRQLAISRVARRRPPPAAERCNFAQLLCSPVDNGRGGRHEGGSCFGTRNRSLLVKRTPKPTKAPTADRKRAKMSHFRRPTVHHVLLLPFPPFSSCSKEFLSYYSGPASTLRVHALQNCRRR